MDTTEQKFRIIAIDDEQEILNYYSEVFAPSDDLLDSGLFELLPIPESEEEAGKEAETAEDVRFELVTTTSGQQGFEILKQGLKEERPFAVAFIDMRMPGWDGLETAREIRAVDPFVTIIFLTAYMDYSLTDLRKSIGDNFSFLTKPINSEELSQVALSSCKTWQQLREVRRLNKSKDDFLASISHELRTPLTAIIGNTELLLEEIGGEIDHTYQDMLQNILKAGQGQLALVNDVLDLSKIQAGRFEVHNEDFDLEELISDVESLFLVRAREKSISFIVEVDRYPEYLLLGDKQRIHQILSNLLSNAFKFTEAGSVELAVSTSDDQITLRVSDSGVGIDEEAQARLFKPFEQANSSISRRFGGTGLGLSISKSLAEMMDGSLSVQSRPGAGSIFTLTLPLIMSSELTREEEQVERGAESEHHLFKGTVLVAEDTPLLQALLGHMLKKYGVQVLVANNGQEAVEIALQQQVDLILMDMQMPEMDGIEATRILRSTSYSAPIVALTANVMDDHRQRFLEAGANGFLAKPIDQQAIIEHLEQYLEPSEENGEDVDETESFVTEEAEELFRHELILNANKLQDALFIDDLSSIQQIAHKLKGVGSSFGYDELSKMGKQVCDAHYHGNFDEARRLSNRMLLLALRISRESSGEDEAQ